MFNEGNIKGWTRYKTVISPQPKHFCLQTFRSLWPSCLPSPSLFGNHYFIQGLPASLCFHCCHHAGLSPVPAFALTSIGHMETTISTCFCCVSVFLNKVSCRPEWLQTYCVAEVDSELLISLPLPPGRQATMPCSCRNGDQT